LKSLNEKHLEEYMDQYRKMNNAESTIIRKSIVYIKACMWLIHIKLRIQEWVGHICQTNGSVSPRKILEGNTQHS
jgi:hypothetical protein